MTRKQRTEYMRQWRREHPDRNLQAQRRQNRKRAFESKGWYADTVTILGVRCQIPDLKVRP